MGGTQFIKIILQNYHYRQLLMNLIVYLEKAVHWSPSIY